MKKFKKLLACICFALIGCFVFTGCSLTSEQQAAIDNLVQSSEKLTSSVDKYLDKVTKEELAEKIMFSRVKFRMGTVEQFHLKVLGTSYEGYFFNSGKELEVITDCYYKDTGSSKIEYFLQSETDFGVFKSDFVNDVHYSYNSSDNSFEQETDKNAIQDRWDLVAGDVLYQLIGDKEVLPEDIKSIEIDGDNIKCKLYYSAFNENGENKDTCLLMEISLEFNGEYLTRAEAKGLAYEYSEDTTYRTNEDGEMLFYADGVPMTKSGTEEIVSQKYVATYEYENIDFSTIDAKIAQVEAEHLTQE